MDMSFLLKSFLPPGVTVEMLQESGKDVLTKILSAAQRIEESFALLTEQNAMLRSVIAQSQAQAVQQPPGDPNVDQTYVVPPQTDERLTGAADASTGPACEPDCAGGGDRSHDAACVARINRVC